MLRGSEDRPRRQKAPQQLRSSTVRSYGNLFLAIAGFQGRPGSLEFRPCLDLR